MVETAANGQRAFAAYDRDRDGIPRAHAIQVPGLTAAGISHLLSFNDASLFPLFGLPIHLLLEIDEPLRVLAVRGTPDPGPAGPPGPVPARAGCWPGGAGVRAAGGGARGPRRPTRAVAGT